MEKRTLLGVLGIFALVILSLNLISAATLAEWSLTSNGVASNVNTNINAGDFIGGAGIKTGSTAADGSIEFAADGADSKYWTTSTSLDSNDYFQITASPKEGFDLTISKINFEIERSSTGPQNYKVQWSKNSDFSSPTNIKDGSLTNSNTESISTSIEINDGETGYIRIFGYNTETEGTGILRILADTLNIEGTATESAVEEEQNFCEYENLGDLKIKIDDINVKSGFGDDEEFWYPFDEIELKIEVDNKGEWDIENIELEWGLYNTEQEDFIFDEKENDFDLDIDDDEKVITLSFKLDQKIKKYKDGDTILYVWATGKINDKDAGLLNKQDTCVQTSQEATIRAGEEFVILNNIKFPEFASCNKKASITFEVVNIGDEKQKDVFVVISNEELGINKKIVVGDIDDFEKKEITEYLEIPKDAEEKLYYIEFGLYDDDGDIYENDEEDKAKFLTPLKVSGNCGIIETPAISAILDSIAEIGKELVIKASITNNGPDASYIITINGYESWANLKNIEPSIAPIKQGETKQIIITLTPTKAGTQTLKINAIHDGQITEQEVQVDIAEKTGSLTGAFAGLGNTGLYIIAVVFLVLIIIIIVLIIRVSSAPKTEEF